ncbi:low temperature requirement protein A [Nesterenkonia sp. F]|uniref:low temperature requirement protein A n=1 Tax=Nesterenkonia sp. F TaxID=795955 RepID=UPI0006829DE5|nr:low temperature requirement protein A [Nesterenkonia sp. F]
MNVAPTSTSRTSLARPASRRSQVAPVELFFDLVYIFAAVQLAQILLGDLSWTGVLEVVILFAAVWWGWNYTAWAMNWLDPARTRIQLLSAVLMLAALGMAVAIPSAFDGQSWIFVGCYLFMGILRPVVMMLAFSGQQLARNYRMLLLWTMFAGVFWIFGAAAPDGWRIPLWLTAVLVDYAAPLAQFRVPFVGSAPMHLWDTDAEHLSRRNRQVFVMALGQCILLMGGAVVDQAPLALPLMASLTVGFASLFVLWWNYFALAGSGAAHGNTSTGALRTAFAYAHALMVLGAILVAVSIELRLTHGALTPAIVVVTTAGPLVYLAGNLMFMRSRFGRLAQSRILAAGLLVVITGVAVALREVIPVAVLSLTVLAITTSLAVYTAVQRRAAAHGGRAT